MVNRSVGLFYGIFNVLIQIYLSAYLLGPLPEHVLPQDNTAHVILGVSHVPLCLGYTYYVIVVQLN